VNKLESSDLSLIEYDSQGLSRESSAEEELESDPTYPNISLIKDLFRKMVDQGFFTPHVRTVYKGDR
jgi:hypothetical protein